MVNDQWAMEFRSTFRRPPGDSIPLLPLHNPPSLSSQISFSSANVHSRYHTAPQSPNLHPTPITQKAFSAEDLSPTMSSPVLRVLQSDAQVAIHRQQSHLESHLQTLLDAQSEGLLAGLGAASPQDDRSSTGRSTSRSTTGTATPTLTTPNHVTWAPPEEARVIPVRQPKPKRIGLRSARRGISRAMADLAVLKTQEAQALEFEVEMREDVLAAAGRIADKDAGLRAEIQKIEAEPTSARVQELKAEEHALGKEIKEVELRLYEMKARQRVLRQEVQGLENGVHAKLSSYKNALSLAEKEAQKFVARPLLEAERTSRVKTGLWALPKERRTLEMVREHYGDESEAIGKQAEDVEKEREALEEGREVWDEVVKAAMDVEEALRAEMKNLQETSREAGMKRMLGRMSRAKGTIEEKLILAEEKGWNLLVVAIGAEVEALGEGYEVLEGASRKAHGEEHSENLIGDVSDKATKGRNGNVNEHGLEELEDRKERSVTGVPGRAEDEDDGPGPDLLVEDHEEI